MLKKVFCFFLVICIVFSLNMHLVSASDDLTLIIDGKKIEADVNPMIIDGRTMVPVRVLFDSFGADVVWNENSRQAVVFTQSTVVVFTIGSKTAYVDGIGRPIDVAPVIVHDRTFVPVRFISSVLGYDVVWNGSTRTVYITNKKSNTSAPSDPENPKEETVPEKSEKSAVLSGINAVKKSATMDITVSLSKKIVPKTMQLSSPDRLVFDFYDVDQTCKSSNIKFENSSVSDIRWGRHEDYTRIVVETTEKTTFSIRFTSTSCIISVAMTEYIPPKEEITNDSKEETNENKPSNDNILLNDSIPIVVIDPGHGGYDSGAIGYDEEGNVVVKEKDVNLTISKHLYGRLKDAGVNVIMTRDTDVALGDTVMADLVSRSEFANLNNADLFISVHNNAFTNSEATGTTVLYAGLETNSDYGINGKELAENILAPLARATGLKNRGIVKSPEMVVLKSTAMPAVIIECGFVTSYIDQKVLTDENKLKDISDAIFDGIMISLRQMGKIQ